MILSVLRNPKHTVKFWFIENFLSPPFSVRFSFPVSGEELPNDVAQEGVRFPVRAAHVQVAYVATPTARKATDHLGIQDPLSRRGPDRAYGPEGANQPLFAAGAVWLYPHGR